MRPHRFRLECYSLTVVGLLLSLAGCAPTPPLDLRIEANSPQNFSQWAEENAFLLPDDVHREFDQALEAIVRRTPRRATSWENENDAVCRRINHLRVREVIVIGIDESIIEITEAITREQQHQADLAERRAQAGTESALHEKSVQQSADRTQRQIDAWKKRIEELEKRRAELDVSP